jgi:hypothetical protein
MVRHQRYQIIYHARIRDHLLAIDRKHHSLIRDAIEMQLSFEPNRKTRNRKPMLHPATFGATWELRLGPENRFRVFCERDPLAHTASTLAIGEKRGNRLCIGGEEITP